jgi:hypothetical protein
MIRGDLTEWLPILNAVAAGSAEGTVKPRAQEMVQRIYREIGARLQGAAPASALSRLLDPKEKGVKGKYSFHMPVAQDVVAMLFKY